MLSVEDQTNNNEVFMSARVSKLPIINEDEDNREDSLKRLKVNNSKNHNTIEHNPEKLNDDEFKQRYTVDIRDKLKHEPMIHKFKMIKERITAKIDEVKIAKC